MGWDCGHDGKFNFKENPKSDLDLDLGFVKTNFFKMTSFSKSPGFLLYTQIMVALEPIRASNTIDDHPCPCVTD